MNKKYLLFGIPAILAIGFVVAAAVYFSTINTTVTVSEALSTLTTTITINPVYPGETDVATFNLTNQASVPLTLSLAWTQQDNANLVSYTTDMPKQVIVQPGENTISVAYTISTDSTIGTFDGNITLARS